jgi:hypothetical protein
LATIKGKAVIAKNHSAKATVHARSRQAVRGLNFQSAALQCSCCTARLKLDSPLMI